MSQTTNEPPPVDPRYAEALRRQKDERKQMTQRRRPILRLVWNRDEQEDADATTEGHLS